LTQTGVALGTANSMAPEQVLGQAVTPATDVYGLGVLLYELATGRPPFMAQSSMGVALKHVDEAPPSPREVNPDLPAWLEQIILRALAKDPVARFPDAAVMEAALAIGVTTGAMPIVSAPLPAPTTEPMPLWWPAVLATTKTLAGRADEWRAAAAQTTSGAPGGRPGRDRCAASAASAARLAGSGTPRG
jgi:serine/threonine protein kinase